MVYQSCLRQAHGSSGQDFDAHARMHVLEVQHLWNMFRGTETTLKELQEDLSTGNFTGSYAAPV